MLYWKEFATMLVLAAVVIGTGLDLWHDYRAGASPAHLVIELVVILASTALIAAVAIDARRQARAIRKLKAELARSAATNPPASPDFVAARHGLAQAAESQFAKWELTEAEQEVAMLLLKGLSFKEIAAVRDSAEKTVRQHASSIYRKAGVAGRHAFSAWFIEDFL